MAERCPFCPNCGYNLEAEGPRSFGPLELDPRAFITWRGKPLRLTASEFIVASTIIQAGGTIVTREIVEERIGYEGLHQVVDVLLCRVRRALRNAGAPKGTIRTEWGRGYALDVDLLVRLIPANDDDAAGGAGCEHALLFGAGGAS